MEETRVYDALATLRNLSDEFASFEVSVNDRKKKKLYTDCRKHIGKVVEELEEHLLQKHGEHSGLSMGIDTGGTINTTTSLMNFGDGRDRESRHKNETKGSVTLGEPPVGKQPGSDGRDRYK